jgi:AbiV family abortive infection protein
LKNTLNQYAGHLTAAAVAKGISAAQENARRLLDDARLLLVAGRLPSAAALAILSMEERGKTILLKRLALVSDPADLKNTWREYRSHRAKNAGWIIPQLVNEGVRTMHGMAKALDQNAEHAGLLDALKQISLYSDCLGKAHWSIPTEVIDESLVQSLVASAELMWGGRSVTVREIELWSEIVGPHYNRSRMSEAVVQWQHAMVAEGLSDTLPETLEAFMRGEPIEVGETAGKDAGSLTD